jgi:hypothetical protein
MVALRIHGKPEAVKNLSSIVRSHVEILTIAHVVDGGMFSILGSQKENFYALICNFCLIDNKVYIVIELVFILKLNCSGTNTQNKRKFVIDSKGLFGVCSVIKNR